MNISLRFVSDFVFESGAFWVAMIVIIIGILLWHNGLVGRSKRQSASNPPQGSSPLNSDSRIRYSNEGRSGRVHYRSTDSSFSLYYEMGGGNCVTWIDIPGTDKWQKITGLPLSQRDAVLNEIGQQVVKDQVSSGKGYYQIEGNALNIYDAV